MKNLKSLLYLVRPASIMVIVAGSIFSAMPSKAVSIFLTGHDPDFHALAINENSAGAQNINKTAIKFVTDPAFNTFTSKGINKFLFVESKISPPSGHLNGVNGIIASGYSLGSDFEHADANTLNAALDQLGKPGGYNAIVVASDFGGVLTKNELDILNDRSSDIINFLNAGGGVYAMSESSSRANLTRNSKLWGFLPFIATTKPLEQFETGYTVTPFGASLGLTSFDVNNNFSHSIFTGTFGLNVVDKDAQGNIVSLAGRSLPVPNTTVPEPSHSLSILMIGTIGIISRRRLRKKSI